MIIPPPIELKKERNSPIEIAPEEFRQLGYSLVDQIATFLATLRQHPVTPGEMPATVRHAIESDKLLPDQGMDPGSLLKETAELLFRHSLFNGHPRFWGYVTSSPAPIGILGDLLASAVNANVGAWNLSPAASEIEVQTVRWIAELIGYPSQCGGLLVSGGNMANFVCFLAARNAKAQWDVRKVGLSGPGASQLRVYASSETHTWINKAVDLFGLGADSIRWIPTDKQQRANTTALQRQLREDQAAGDLPFLVVGSAGAVSTGAIDPLSELAAICQEWGTWFHVDGAYGGFAASVPELSDEFDGLGKADSVAVDPHKWLYAPLEAGCALVRDRDALRRAFSYHPPYYHFAEEVVNYFDLGPQNSRGFRALKVWLALRQVGRTGYQQMIGEDIQLARNLHGYLANYPDLEAMTQGLSITTFRYVPLDLKSDVDSASVSAYLNTLNQELLTRLEKSGEAFLSNALIEGKFALRLCVVNFRTSQEDIKILPGLISRLGREVDAQLRPSGLGADSLPA